MKDSRAVLAGVISTTTLKKGASKKYARSVAAYLLDNHTTGELNSLMRDVQADWARDGYVEVLCASAYPLSASVKQEIIKQIKAIEPNAKQIVVTEIHDEQVIGGVRLSLADRQLDMSIEAKLQKFKQLTTSKSGKD